LRAGTENVPAIVGFGAACALATSRLTELPFDLLKMRERMDQGLRTMGAVLFGDGAVRLPIPAILRFLALTAKRW